MTRFADEGRTFPELACVSEAHLPPDIIGQDGIDKGDGSSSCSDFCVLSGGQPAVSWSSRPTGRLCLGEDSPGCSASSKALLGHAAERWVSDPDWLEEPCRVGNRGRNSIIPIIIL